MKYLKLLAKVEERLESLSASGHQPELVVFPPNAEMETEENRGLVEKLLGVPVEIDVDLEDGFKIEVKMNFKF